VYVDGGRTPTGKAVLPWAKEVYDRGPGDLLTFDGHDGTKTVLPSILPGWSPPPWGFPSSPAAVRGKMEHFRDVFQEGKADAALAASIFPLP
jgi:cyclase